MASVNNTDNFKGSVGNLTYYSRKGSKQIFVRTKSGLTKEQINTQETYVNVRRNNLEFGACSKVSKEIRTSFDPFKHLTDFQLSPGLIALAKRIQKVDQENEWGERSIHLSQFKQYLVGCEFNKVTPFSAMISLALKHTINREKQEAIVQIPDFTANFALTAPDKYPSFRLSICLGLASDYQIAADKSAYEPCHNRTGIVRNHLSTDWYSTQGSVTRQEMQVDLANFGITFSDTDTLILSIAIEFANIDITGKAMIIKGVGAGKILEVG